MLFVSSVPSLMMIIINDSKFEDAKSFVNEGPIAAAKERKSHVFWYDMANDGLGRVDSIGEIFGDLKSCLDLSRSKKEEVSFFKEGRIGFDMNKGSMYLLHDIVLIMGVPSYKEIVSFLVSSFGDGKYDLIKNIIGVLRSSGFLSVHNLGDESGRWFYRSNKRELLLDYGFSTHKLMASFRSFFEKNDMDRLRVGRNE